MPKEEIPLRDQRCGLCYYWRPTESPKGQCRHELPKREVIHGTPVAVFVPIDAGGWCAKWKLYPEERPSEFKLVEQTSPSTPVGPSDEVSHWKETNKTDTPVPKPTPGGTWQGTITRGGGKPTPQKWKRDEGPDTTQAPPELKSE